MSGYQATTHRESLAKLRESKKNPQPKKTEELKTAVEQVKDIAEGAKDALKDLAENMKGKDALKALGAAVGAYILSEITGGGKDGRKEDSATKTAEKKSASKFNNQESSPKIIPPAEEIFYRSEDFNPAEEDYSEAPTYKPAESNTEVNADQLAKMSPKMKEILGDHIGKAKNLSVMGERREMLNPILENYEKNKFRYRKVAEATDLPPVLIAAIHYLEGGMNFNTYLHNGQKLGKPTTIVPKGILFNKGEWEEAAIHALGGKISDRNGNPSKDYFRNIAKKLGLRHDSKNMEMMMAFGEYYNGLGYRKIGKESLYVYAGSNFQTPGKFTEDGKFDPKAESKRVGLGVIVQALLAKEKGQTEKSLI